MSFCVQHPLEHDIEPSMNNVYGHICPSPRSFIDLTNFSLRLRSWICSRPLTVVCPWLQLILPILYVWDDLTSCIKYAFDSISRRKVHKYWQSSECSQTKNASHIHGKIKWTKFVHQIFSFTHKAFIFCKLILREETVDGEYTIIWQRLFQLRCSSHRSMPSFLVKVDVNDFESAPEVAPFRGFRHIWAYFSTIVNSASPFEALSLMWFIQRWHAT